jgi:hypothetical protein
MREKLNWILVIDLQVKGFSKIIQGDTIRSYEYLNGEYHDRVIYGLLKEEWNLDI